MFKFKYEKEGDGIVVFRHGSRARAVAKRQVLELARLGELQWFPGLRKDVAGFIRLLNEPRTEQYARYRGYCRRFGIRY